MDKTWLSDIGSVRYSFIHSFITICRAHYVESVESEALEAVARWSVISKVSKLRLKLSSEEDCLTDVISDDITGHRPISMCFNAVNHNVGCHKERRSIHWRELEAMTNLFQSLGLRTQLCQSAT